jgi:ubiquinone/menaquinone biosynthesis C-methylase UbiE
MNTPNHVGYSNWVCPKCKGTLRVEDGRYLCGPCGLRFSDNYGIPDFRLNDYDSESNLLLAMEYIKSWEELTYEDMVHMRFSGLRKRALAAGKSPVAFRMWELDEKSHLASYKSRGKCHLDMIKNTLKRRGQAGHITRLIDVGCGWGRDLLHLSTLADEVVGVDVSTFSLLLTRKLLQEHGVSNVTLVLAEGQSLPFPSKCIDGINSSATIEHFPVPGDFLRECSRCLRNSGWIFLYYPNRFSILPETHTGIWGLGFWSPKRQKEILRRRTGGEWNVTLFSRSSFIRLLRSTAEYKKVAITGVPNGIEQFLYTSKFAGIFFGLPHVLKYVLPAIHVIPGLNRLVSFFAPVHFVFVSR